MGMGDVMAKAKARNIQTWQVALIKALWRREQHTKDQIISLFSRPDRMVNPYPVR